MIIAQLHQVQIIYFSQMQTHATSLNLQFMLLCLNSSYCKLSQVIALSRHLCICRTCTYAKLSSCNSSIGLAYFAQLISYDSNVISSQCLEWHQHVFLILLVRVYCMLLLSLEYCNAQHIMKTTCFLAWHTSKSYYTTYCILQCIY